MVKRKWIHIAKLSVVALFLMTNYQNCAPAGKLGANGGADGGMVGVIDPATTKGALAFLDEDMAVQSPAKSAAVDGICREDQIGATFDWVLRDLQGNDLSQGSADCGSSGFTVELAPTLAQLDCGQSYQLYARLGVSESEPIVINHECQ